MNPEELQYVTNQAGQKTAVILPIHEFEEMLEDLRDLAVVAERRDEPIVAHEEVTESLMAQLRKIKISAPPDFSVKASLYELESDNAD